MKKSSQLLCFLIISCAPSTSELTNPVSGGICKTLSEELLDLEVKREDKCAIKIDFTRNTVCSINEASKNQFVRIENYAAVRSSWKKNKPFVVIDIDGKPIDFRIDPGFEGTIAMMHPETISFAGVKFSATSLPQDQNRIGRGFIKCFDWIIDCHSKEIFVHRNYNAIAQTPQQPLTISGNR